jgi:hypothetical protein
MVNLPHLSPSSFSASCQLLHLLLAGVLVVASAGNYQESLLSYLPVACPAVAAVTSIDPASGAPSAYSNFLPADASDAAKARVIAAPGNGVLSTISIQRESSRYRWERTRCMIEDKMYDMNKWLSCC